MTLRQHAQARTPEHWGTLAAYFSMDLTEPFWEKLGFVSERGVAECRAALRDMILRLRQAAVKSPNPLPDIRDWVFTDGPLAWTAQEQQSFLELGINFEATHSEKPHISSWASVLIYFPGMFDATVAAVNDPDAISHILEMRDSELPTDAPEKLSMWDAQMCARHGWNPKDELEYFPPLDELSIVENQIIADQILRWAAVNLDPAAQRVFWENAQAAIDELGVWIPEPLKPLHLKV